MSYRNAEDARARQQRYNEEHREEKRLYAKGYYATHKEQIAEKTHLAYMANPERRLAAAREYGKTHAEERLQRFLKWLKTPNGIAYNRARKHARRTTGKIGIADFYAKCEHLNWRCQICGRELTKETVTIDHIVPVIRGGTNVIENLQPLCRSCNGRKGARSMQEVLCGGENLHCLSGK